MPRSWSITLPAVFDLRSAVCSYGFHLLAPNRWERDRLVRPLRDAAGGVATATIRQRGRRLGVAVDRPIERGGIPLASAGIRRMLRLDEDLTAWRALHRPAARRRFGRIFRSPTLFEDIVKTITSCNVAWTQTLRMNQLLCDHVGLAGDFPTPHELAAWSPRKLAEVCRVGYRAERIVRLARQVADGRLDLAWFEHPARSTEELDQALRRLYGIGPYAANNILQLLGRYDRLPVDSELIRHMKQAHGARGSVARIAAAARRRYEPFAPYQFLAYWFELWFRYDLTPSPRG
jgi:3-methyladenine DNA glycosylase/8-oxoguanine DNA glycosylase